MDHATTVPPPTASVAAPAAGAGRLIEAARDIAAERIVLANVAYVGEPGRADGWVLVDAGPFHPVARIVRSAEERFGAGARPRAIVLTHGHFDHVGTVKDLADRWDVAVYAHELELPYLTGRSSYPPPDPTVGGGLLSTLSWLYPRGPIDLGARVRPLPADYRVPEMPGWRWVPTPGHSPGHVSLFRDSDRALIAGDAFITTKQESVFSVVLQTPVIHGPPTYYTMDWVAARDSVRRLAELRPAVAISGHGLPLAGDGLARGLETLARDFERLAVPRRGRYVGLPAIADRDGVRLVPPAPARPYLRAAAAAGIAIGAVVAALAARRRV